MKKRILSLFLVLAMVLALLPAAVSAAGPLTEIRITGSTTAVVTGELPVFTVATSTPHVSIEEYASNTHWTYRADPNTYWTSFGWNTPYAINDGATHYALCLCVDTDEGYSINDTTKIYYNGKQVGPYFNLITPHTWGAFVFIDLGPATGKVESVYTVNFEVNGGSAVASQTVVDGHVVLKPTDPGRIGYSFGGWYTDAALTKEYNFSTPVHTDFTLYAKWIESTALAELRIQCDTETVKPGVLQPFTVSTTTPGARIEPYGSNTRWQHQPNHDGVWHSFGNNTPTAVNDGKTHYALRLCVMLDDQLCFGSGTKIYLNGRLLGSEVQVDQYVWGAFVIVDLGTAEYYDGEGWYLDSKGCLHITGAIHNPSTPSTDSTPWKDYKHKIKSVVAESAASIDNGTLLFAYCTELTSVDLKRLDTSKAASMFNMFCLTSLTCADLSSFDTTNVTDMSGMFALSPFLLWLDVSSFTVKPETKTANMFLIGEKLSEITISHDLLAKTADQLLLYHTKWYNKADSTCYTTEAELQAISGKVTLSVLPFTDVKRSDYFFEPVVWAVANNITNGTTPTTFGPAKPCTRGQVVTFLWRAAGEPEPSQTENPFTDVKADSFCYKAVLWAVENGITNGTSPTTFGPSKPCTRGQVVTFQHRAHGCPQVTGTCDFEDVQTGSFYYDAVIWAVENDITNGTSDTKFSPSKTCTRGQIVTFLFRDYAK